MKVSIIIPTYNRSNILNYTLLSLIEQDFPAREYEVIVIDDDSSDNTKEVVESYQDKLNIIYYFQEDKGFRVALARNEGIKRASGEVLVFIDTGIVVGNTFVRAHYDAHNEDPSEKYAVIGYVYGFSYEHKEGDSTPEFMDFKRPNQMLQNLKLSSYYSDMRELVYSKINDDLDSIPVPWMLFYTNNVSVRKTDFVNAGCFDEDFIRWGVEDVECAYRLHKNNLKFKLSRDACGVHYPNERSIENDSVSEILNNRLFYKKHQDDVIELYSTFNTYVFIDEYFEFLAQKERMANTPLFSSLLNEEAISFLSKEISDKKNIIFGSQDGFLLDVCKSAASTESDNELILKAKERHSDAQIHRCLGVRTPYKTKAYDVSLVAGSAIILNEKFLNFLVTEAARVSKKVYWLKVNNEANVTNYTYTEVKDLGNGVVLCEIDSKV